MAASETDPLLPQGSSAPEISGYGFSRPSKARYQPQKIVIEQTEYAKDEDVEDRSTEGFSPLRILLTLFTIVVGLAVFVTLLLPGTLDTPWRGPKDDTRTIEARVNKILTENPLIGLESRSYSVGSILSDIHHQMAIMTLLSLYDLPFKTIFTTRISHRSLKTVACMLT